MSPGADLDVVALAFLAPPFRTRIEADVNALIQYLLDRLQLEFDGEITLAQVQEFLREDAGRDAKALQAKLQQAGVDDMLITLAACLRDRLQLGIDERVVREKLVTYAED
jgi:hypothetical protein